MAAPDPVAIALLTEHLGYTPLSLIDDIINALNALIYQSVAAVETFLLSAPPASLGFETARAKGGKDGANPIVDTDDQGNIVYPEAEIELSQGIHSLETLLEATVDKTFDKFEIYVLRNIFAIEDALLPYITLPHYKGLDFEKPQLQGQEEVTIEMLKEHRVKLSAERKFKAILEKEKAKNDALIAQLKALTQGATAPTTVKKAEGDVEMQDVAEDTSQPGPLAFLTNIKAEGSTATLAQPSANAHPLTDSSSFAVAQLPYIKSMLERLRPFLEQQPELADDEDEGEEAESEGADVRAKYIESRTRIHIERQQEHGAPGLDDADAGEWTGRRVANADFRNLESFLKTLDEGRTPEQQS